MASPQQQAEAPASSAGSAENPLERYLEIEEEFCAASDYAAMFRDGACSPNLVWREMVCKWQYDVVDLMGEARSVVYVAMNILDRFCAVTEATMNEKRYECASMTALFLAARVAGTCNLQMSDLIHMSRDSIQLQDIISTGKQMLNVLTWGQRMITPVDFLTVMLGSCLPASVDGSRRTSLFESASFLAEIAVCDIYLSRFPASQVAFSSILNAACLEHTLTSSELDAFCDQMERKASLLHSSMDTIVSIRARIQSVYQRIEDDNEDSSSNAPHYISDDEDNEDDPCPAVSARKRTFSTDDGSCHDLQQTLSEERASHRPHSTKRPRRQSFSLGTDNVTTRMNV